MSQIAYIIDVTTNEVIEREMTKEELEIEKAERTQREAIDAAAKVEQEILQTAKLQLLDKLGITADEVKLLLQ